MIRIDKEWCPLVDTLIAKELPEKELLITREELLNEMEKGSIPSKLMNEIVGKAIRILSYRNKKGKTSTWNQVSSPLRKKEAFKDYFMKEYNKSKKKPKGPWPSNYEPNDFTETTGDSFGFGANTESVDVSGQVESF